MSPSRVPQVTCSSLRLARTGTSPTGSIASATTPGRTRRRSAPGSSGVDGVTAVPPANDHRHDHEHRGHRGGQPGDDAGAPTAGAAYLAEQSGQQRVGQRLVRRRALQDARVDPTEQAGEAGELTDRAGAVVAAAQVPLELHPLGRGEGAEDVGRVVVGERAAHALTPISSRASFSARNA